MHAYSHAYRQKHAQILYQTYKYFNLSSTASSFLNSAVEVYYASAPNRRGRKAMMLSHVCLTSVTYIGPKLRTERPRKTKIGTEVAHVTRDSDTTFKVKGHGHQAALLTAVLTRQAAAVVRVGTY